LSDAHDALLRRGFQATGAYIDIGEASDADRPGLESLIADQEQRRATPFVFVTSLEALAARTDVLIEVMQRFDTSGATLIGPGFDRPLHTKKEAL